MATFKELEPFLNSNRAYIYKDNIIDAMMDVQDQVDFPVTNLVQIGSMMLVAYKSESKGVSLIIIDNEYKNEYLISCKDMVDILREIGRKHNFYDPILFMHYLS